MSTESSLIQSTVAHLSSEQRRQQMANNAARDQTQLRRMTRGSCNCGDQCAGKAPTSTSASADISSSQQSQTQSPLQSQCTRRRDGTAKARDCPYVQSLMTTSQSAHSDAATAADSQARGLYRMSKADALRAARAGFDLTLIETDANGAIQTKATHSAAKSTQNQRQNRRRMQQHAHRRQYLRLPRLQPPLRSLQRP